jgi:hypothetical protein
VATLRQRWTVSWDGRDPIEVTTTVHDLITAVDRVPPESAGNNIALNASLIYAALERKGLCKLTYEAWLEVLDMYEEVRPTTNGSGPTKRAPSAPAPLPSRALPEPIGEVGLTATQEPLKPQNNS